MKTRVIKENKLTLIEITVGEFVVTLCDLGASLYGIKYHKDEMILRVKNPSDYLLSDLYFGKTIGRVCGRSSIQPFEIDGEKYRLQDNNNGASLHGGLDGLSNKFFIYDIFENPTSVIVTFECLSKDKEAGYPGNLSLKIIYTISKDKILLKFVADIDKPCLLSLTNHAYFNLGEDDVNKLWIKAKASKCVQFDERLFPVKLVDTEHKWDFKEGKDLSKTGEIDNYFLFDDTKEVILASKKYKLSIKTDFLGVQLYTDNFITNVEVTSSEKEAHRSIAIEPEDNPLDRKVLRPNTDYERNIEYRFEKL